LAEACIKALQAEAGEGTAAFADYFIKLFAGVRDILREGRDDVQAGDAGAPDRMYSRLAEHLVSFFQSDYGLPPGFAELMDRLLLLDEEFRRLSTELGDL